ncbi:MAG: ABC transporter ATP-binding protein [Candidatus Nanopelagicales bacterium]
MSDSYTEPEDLELIRVSKRFGSFTAVDDLSLVVPSGSFFALLGPSGCGKTTTLRMVAGLEQPTEGQIKLGSKDITTLRPYKRPINTVFQSYALFPHLDVFENVAFGLRRSGVKGKEVESRVTEMLELIELSHLANRKPGQLSGGQQQRVAVVRALVNRPHVLLLDEPLGALDLKLRRQMQIELKRIQSEVGTTFVHVTHDQEEAMTMADTIAIMNQGVIEQMGAPEEMYELPKTAFVANFLGQSNLVEGRVSANEGENLVVDVPGGQVRVMKSRATDHTGSVVVGVRPEKMWVVANSEHEVENSVRGEVIDVSFTGVSIQYTIESEWDRTITCFEQNLDVEKRVVVGEKVRIAWEIDNTFGLDGGEDLEAGVEYLGDTEE